MAASSIPYVCGKERRRCDGGVPWQVASAVGVQAVFWSRESPEQLVQRVQLLCPALAWKVPGGQPTQSLLRVDPTTALAFPASHCRQTKRPPTSANVPAVQGAQMPAMPADPGLHCSQPANGAVGWVPSPQGLQVAGLVFKGLAARLVPPAPQVLQVGWLTLSWYVPGRQAGQPFWPVPAEPSWQMLQAVCSKFAKVPTAQAWHRLVWLRTLPGRHPQAVVLPQTLAGLAPLATAQKRRSGDATVVAGQVSQPAAFMRPSAVNLPIAQQRERGAITAHAVHHAHFGAAGWRNPPPLAHEGGMD